MLEVFAPLVSVPGRPDLSAHQAADVFALWMAWEKESGRTQDVPYWATVWPAARMLASFLVDRSDIVTGRTVLDFGCGCGIAGIAALKAGARKVIANDTDPVALWMSARNAAANGLASGLELQGKDLLRLPPSPEIEVILVADMFYDRTVSTAMVDWLGKARAQGTQVFIADACRPFAPKTGVTTLLEATYPTNADLEGRSERTVRLLALSDTFPINHEGMGRNLDIL